VNTSEQVQVLLASGGGLDEADKLMAQKLWSRALEQLETMPPFPQPEQDAYRLYDLGVVNEALGYQAEDVAKARKDLQEAAQQIASHLVNTTEQVDVYLAKGGGLDEADKLMDEKLWSRALEQLETMKPFASAEDDAYRLYDLGVVNEAMGYAAEDVQSARKDLQQASIDYGKAIDAKPTEKYFLQPQNRIDTALAHYKILGEQKAPVEASAAAAGASSAAAKGAAANAMTNEQVIAMVSAGLDEANIIDTIKHAKAVNFDLSVQGQVDLSRNKVTGPVITAMKARARAPAPATHHVAGTSGKSAS